MPLESIALIGNFGGNKKGGKLCLRQSLDGKVFWIILFIFRTVILIELKHKLHAAQQ